MTVEFYSKSLNWYTNIFDKRTFTKIELVEDIDAGYHWEIQTKLPDSVIVTYEHLDTAFDESGSFESAIFTFEYDCTQIEPTRVHLLCIPDDFFNPTYTYSFLLVGIKPFPRKTKFQSFKEWLYSYGLFTR